MGSMINSVLLFWRFCFKKSPIFTQILCKKLHANVSAHEWKAYEAIIVTTGIPSLTGIKRFNCAHICRSHSSVQHWRTMPNNASPKQLLNKLQDLIKRVEKGLADLKKLEREVRSTNSACNKTKIGGTVVTAAGALGVCAGLAAAVCSFITLNPILVTVAGFASYFGGTFTNVSAEYIRDTRNRFVTLVFFIVLYHSNSIREQRFLLSFGMGAFSALRRTFFPFSGMAFEHD